MKADDPLRALASLPRPRLSPFFAARVAARATEEPGAARPLASRLMRLYWLGLAMAAGGVLVQSWTGVAALALAGGVLAFPAGTVRLSATLVAAMARRR